MPIDVTAPNLVVIDITAPAAAVLGETISVTYTVQNAGAVSAPTQWVDAIFVSGDAAAGNDVLLDDYVTDSVTRPLLPGETYVYHRDVDITDTRSGDRYLLVVTDVDDDQSETQETDNFLAVPICITAPDLVVSTAMAPMTAVSESAITLTYTVTNQGDGPALAGWHDRVYLSPSPFYDGTLLLDIDANSRAPLAPGETYTESHLVTLPTGAAGAQFLRFYTDRLWEQQESDEENNVRVLPLNLSTTDLVVSEVTAPAATKVGESTPIAWTVRNLGSTSSTETWHDAVYASADSTWDANDALVAEFSAAPWLPLAANSIYEQTAEIVLPGAAAGDRYLLLVADADQQQSETKNRTIAIDCDPRRRR